jgi:hypothetical protein
LPWSRASHKLHLIATAAETDSFEGQIVVASRIVDALSSGLYESPAACLKELVNNAYDADAKVVQIYVKPDADQIVIQDDGTGLSRDEFVKHFSRISESHKRDAGELTSTRRRPKVGKIGIGFIAANELCDVMELESTKAGSIETLRVEIDFALMREDLKDRRVEGTDDIRKGDYRGRVDHDADPETHYTRIYLHRVRGEAREAMVSARRQSAEETEADAETLYGLTPEQAAIKLAPGRVKSWTEFDRYSQVILGVGLNVPVRYADPWVPQPHRRKVRALAAEVKDLDFSVRYDGLEMFKPIILGEAGKRSLLRRLSLKGKEVSAKGYMFAQHGALRPGELQGVLVRIRNAAVGAYDHSFLDFPVAEAQLLKNWVSCELWATDALEEAMNIDRKTLRATHPAYVELQHLFHTELRRFLYEVRTQLYATGSHEKRTEEAVQEASRIAELVNRADLGLATSAIEMVEATWAPPAPEDKQRTRQLLRKRTLAEFYEIVLDLARERMDEDDFQEFVQELTDRLDD